MNNNDTKNSTKEYASQNIAETISKTFQLEKS